MGAGKLALDPALPFLAYDRLRSASPSLDVVDATPVVDGCRAVKSATELALLQFAKDITLKVQKAAAAILAPGISTGEVQALHRRRPPRLRRRQAAPPSSRCSIGLATAYPHGLPGEQTLKDDDLVLIDTGCLIDGYNSDITRTYVYGEPTAEHRRIWTVEHEAQAAAFDAVRPGVPCEVIDHTARAVLEREGLGPDYRLPGLPHRTGHGIGLSIHEAPYLVRGDTTPLQPGMCFSNEPMIVIPDAFGIRLEDHFHVTETGRPSGSPSPRPRSTNRSGEGERRTSGALQSAPRDADEVGARGGSVAAGDEGGCASEGRTSGTPASVCVPAPPRCPLPGLRPDFPHGAPAAQAFRGADFLTAARRPARNPPCG